MADKRMFSKQIVDSDAFLEMPLSTQALYFHLSMRADDDGFLNNAAKIRKIIGASEDDLKLLILKKFVIDFDDGIIVIKHWRINNYLRTDRYRETVYLEEKSMLEVNQNGSYSLKKDFGIPDGNQVVYQPDTQYRIVENSIDKNSIVESNTHAREEEKNTYFDLEKNATVLFQQWGNKNGFANMKVEWLNRFIGVPEQNWLELANRIKEAVRAYLKDYKKMHPNEQVEYQYLKPMDKFFKEDLDFWLEQIKQRKESEEN
jgi:hypothetical protein